LDAHPPFDFDVTAAVERVRAGDEESARLLVQHLYPLVIKIVRSHLPRRTVEEDLAQMIFVRVFTRLDQWRATAPFTHWVSRIAVNVCLSQIDYERVRPEWRMADLSEEQADVLEVASGESGDEDHGSGIADRELVEKILARLEPKDRLVLQLLDMDGRSVADVSAITGWGQSSVKVRAFRARRKVRAFLSELLKERKVK